MIRADFWPVANWRFAVSSKANQGKAAAQSNGRAPIKWSEKAVASNTEVAIKRVLCACVKDVLVTLAVLCARLCRCLLGAHVD